MTPPRSTAVLRGGAPHRDTQVTSAVVVLHGGREESQERVTSTQPAVVRMLDMYVGLRRHSRAAAVYFLRHRVRGWNSDRGGEPAPVVDARWALDEITRRHPGVPIALLGHSMGGRTAFAVAGDERVVGVCALAPWLPDGEPMADVRAGQRFLIAHGTADRMTSAPASLRYAQRLRAAGAAVVRLELEGGRHALLDKPLLWHRLAVSVPLGFTGDRPLPRAVAAAFADEAALRLPLQTVAGR